MQILGISAFYHDSAAAILVDGKVIAAAQEERFSRKKHDSAFPSNAIKYCLMEAQIEIADLDAVVFYDKPLLKFERLLETYYSFAPRGIRSFILSIPVWLREKMFLKKVLKDELKKIGEFNVKSLRFLFPEHHLSHAASTFFPSPYKEAAILTIDGVGEWATASISHGNGKNIKVLKELRFPHSLGLLYSAFTYYLGFKVNSGEYKLMGLAPYGDPDSMQVKEFIETIKRILIDIREDGSIWLNQDYFNYATGLKMTRNKKWEKLFGFPKRKSESSLEQVHCNLGLAIQSITEEVVEKMAKEAKRLTNAEYLCMSGGVALNCVSNGKLKDKAIFKDIYITPASGDAGGALGAALAAHYIYFDKDRMSQPDTLQDQLSGSFLGPRVSEADIVSVINKFDAVSHKVEDFDKLCSEVAKWIDTGNAVGWVQGRMEFGPRALGARSILGDPRNEQMQKKLNLKIKYRESFRPFAPSVLAEDVADYFELDGDSPYMLLVKPVKNSIRKSQPEGYQSMGLKDKLYTLRSALPAITHIDYSARIQTVHKDTNEKYWMLINAFKRLTGCSVLVNTSFNVRGEPIVCTAEDAYACFMRTEMDYLVINNHYFVKSQQTTWKESSDWTKEYTLD